MTSSDCSINDNNFQMPGQDAVQLLVDQQQLRGPLPGRLQVHEGRIRLQAKKSDEHNFQHNRTLIKNNHFSPHRVRGPDPSADLPPRHDDGRVLVHVRPQQQQLVPGWPPAGRPGAQRGDPVQAEQEGASQETVSVRRS